MNLSDLQSALDRCIANGYTTFISYYSNKVHVTLSRYATSAHPLNLEVKSEGDTVAEAFEVAFRNFPANPLDGVSRWANNQITKGKITDGEFTETN